jgi:hypothetical protein
MRAGAGRHQTRVNKGTDLKYERYDARFLQVRTKSPSRRDDARKLGWLVPEVDRVYVPRRKDAPMCIQLHKTPDHSPTRSIRRIEEFDDGVLGERSQLLFFVARQKTESMEDRDFLPSTKRLLLNRGS